MGAAGGTYLRREAFPMTFENMTAISCDVIAGYFTTSEQIDWALRVEKPMVNLSASFADERVQSYSEPENGRGFGGRTFAAAWS